MQTYFAKPDAYPVDGRAVSYSMAFFSAKHLGDGPVLSDDHRGQGRPALRRRQHLSPDRAAERAVKLYWSATVYDRATHALIRDMAVQPFVADSGAAKECGRSVDIYFAPKAPQGKESNWVPTNAGGEFEVLFRLYGPEKPLFDKTWKLPDIERITAQ